ncbi:uncharacterized protein EV154DRAFT_480467 [Mucor mucedo]|uniref:uncharacterized protein n=1 Tax=Mucor mucedo TaxID=29922 RepID=UPI0022207B40|nr:uncharacterized protein EV154DRAFT_480467 [Mucor mucedo]KAI7892290.1 hypothetical protein EV154DRAFT_480467 [Mucor mucedo]
MFSTRMYLAAKDGPPPRQLPHLHGMFALKPMLVQVRLLRLSCQGCASTFSWSGLLTSYFMLGTRRSTYYIGEINAENKDEIYALSYVSSLCMNTSLPKLFPFWHTLPIIGLVTTATQISSNFASGVRVIVNFLFPPGIVKGSEYGRFYPPTLKLKICIFELQKFSLHKELRHILRLVEKDREGSRLRVQSDLECQRNMPRFLNWPLDKRRESLYDLLLRGKIRNR